MLVSTPHSSRNTSRLGGEPAHARALVHLPPRPRGGHVRPSCSAARRLRLFHVQLRRAAPGPPLPRRAPGRRPAPPAGRGTRPGARRFASFSKPATTPAPPPAADPAASGAASPLWVRAPPLRAPRRRPAVRGRAADRDRRAAASRGRPPAPHRRQDPPAQVPSRRSSDGHLRPQCGHQGSEKPSCGCSRGLETGAAAAAAGREDLSTLASVLGTTHQLDVQRERGRGRRGQSSRLLLTARLQVTWSIMSA